jgi:hypothetical protein
MQQHHAWHWPGTAPAAAAHARRPHARGTWPHDAGMSRAADGQRGTGTGPTPCHICTGTGPTPCHICTGTGPTPCHICTGTGLTLLRICTGTGLTPCHICTGTGRARRLLVAAHRQRSVHHATLPRLDADLRASRTMSGAGIHRALADLSRTVAISGVGARRRSTPAEHAIA